MIKPKGWRTGQTIFNFLEWLQTSGLAQKNQSERIADPFHLSDSDWDKYYEIFINQFEIK